jgi:hypothetical protein
MSAQSFSHDCEGVVGSEGSAVVGLNQHTRPRALYYRDAAWHCPNCWSTSMLSLRGSKRSAVQNSVEIYSSRLGFVSS